MQDLYLKPVALLLMGGDTDLSQGTVCQQHNRTEIDLGSESKDAEAGW